MSIEFKDEDEEENLRIRVNATQLCPTVLASGPPCGCGDSLFEETERCSKECYQVAGNEARPASLWSSEEIALLERLLPAYSNFRNGACMLALVIPKPCVDVCPQPQLY